MKKKPYKVTQLLLNLLFRYSFLYTVYYIKKVDQPD